MARGSFDAIHLATVVQLPYDTADLAVATHDRELAVAAAAVAFQVAGV